MIQLIHWISSRRKHLLYITTSRVHLAVVVTNEINMQTERVADVNISTGSKTHLLIERVTIELGSTGSIERNECVRNVTIGSAVKQLLQPGRVNGSGNEIVNVIS